MQVVAVGDRKQDQDDPGKYGPFEMVDASEARS